MHKFGLHNLSLVLAPFSNQEGEWLWKDEQVRAIASQSKLYMIGQRHEVLFENYGGSESERNFTFDLVCDAERIDKVVLPLDQFSIPQGWTLEAEMGPKIIRVWKCPPAGSQDEKELVHWFTPDRLFYYYGKGDVAATNLEDFRKFTTFELYYVGISKKGDSFARLFKTAHEKRSRILGNESQFTPTARLTDELMIFLMRVEDMTIHVYHPDEFDDGKALGSGAPIPADVLAADAEKAFVRMMKSKYNAQTYQAYPKSTDGLWTAGFERYGFTIADPVSFRTADALMRGGSILTTNDCDQPDLICIEGEDVTLLSVDDMKARLAALRKNRIWAGPKRLFS